MNQINSIEDYLQTFQSPDWEMTEFKEGWTYQARSHLGKGYLKIYGNLSEFYYVKSHFQYTRDYLQTFSIKERYIEISNNLADGVALGEFGAEKLHAGKGLNCHINLGNMSIFQNFPSGTRLQVEALLIREKFLMNQSIPFTEKVLFDMASALRSGGLADPRFAFLFKQLQLFPLSTEYGQIYLRGKAYEAIAILQDKVKQIKWVEPKLSPEEIHQLKNAVEYMKAHYTEAIGIEKLTRKFALNKNKLQSGFKTLTGYSVHECLLNVRVQHAMELLATCDDTIHVIANKVGFKHGKNLYEAFSKFLGFSPNQYRQFVR